MWSVVILKANPGILKHGGGIKMRLWLCRKSYLEFGNKVRMRKIGRNIEAKKDAIRVVYMAMDQKTQEVVEMVDSCCDGYELFRIAKRLGKRKMLQELVILEMKVGQ